VAEAKKQIRLTRGGLQDRFMITVSVELGKEVRKNAEKENMSLSAYLGILIEESLERRRSGEK